MAARINHSGEVDSNDFGPDVNALYLANFVDDSKLMDYLQTVPFQRVSYPKYGKVRNTPRLTFCYGGHGIVSYRGKRFRTEPIPPVLDALRARIESLLDVSFNAVILNLYQDGSDYINWHQDDEQFLEHKTIASISLGASRDFQFKSAEGNSVHQISLTSGSLFVIDNGLLHCLPKRAKAGLRYNITFRQVNSALGYGNYYYYNRGSEYSL